MRFPIPPRAGLLSGAAALACALTPNPAWAQVEGPEGDDPHAEAGHEHEERENIGVVRDQTTGDIIYVYGRGERRIGEAIAASEGGVAGADIELRPLLRPGEILEATPGLIATQHSGGGKANQFFLRGFNLDHGTDYAVYIDDMPVNFRTHGHGQGYLDVNGLIPESVERVDYRKGPYRADTGDFSFVGSSFITTKDRLQPFATAEAGSYGYRRFVAGGSTRVGSGDLLAIGQVKLNDGPWELAEDFEGYSGFLKYSTPIGDADFQVSLNVFDASWNPTEQLPERVIDTDLCEDRFCALDTTLTGYTKRQVLTANYESDNWRITGYAQHYDWSLLSNFTYFLEDPVNGDQLRQFEERWTFGGRVERFEQLTDRISLRVGAEARHDDIGPVGLDETIDGELEFNYNSFDVTEKSLGLYAEVIVEPVERLFVTAGLRGDWYGFETSAIDGVDVWSGDVSDETLAPKIGVNYEVTDGIALYANYGEGFHSNDARGVTNPADPAPGLVEGDFEELGFRFERGGLIFTGVYFWSSIDSELIYVGDSGAVEPSDPGKRRGYELTAFWKPNNWLAVDGVWTGTRSRFDGLPEGENYVPGALENSGELGLSAAFPEWNAAARIRYLGPHALIEDNSQRGASTLLVNARLAWTPQDFWGLEVYGEVLNLFDSEADDIDYFYATRFPGEPAEGIEGRNSRIVEPRQVRVGVTKRF
ncbi:TonB-dependent receptor [Alteraurantiacibacter aquimixticola]|uniref:TonB-dependent receptor n=1 Tax=Alteraurantiacibacter aquimixticola TaxID=2489173 RepID=A0A4T3F1P7_9SPHN|nr:TonB-dependent receptor [Alteraurantiacibacter aquimixticola]TIX51008.1 TonB-dependent receptor [Alteraurantiacibacter aquimixticola]